MKKIELVWDYREAVLPSGERVQLDLTEAKVLREILRGPRVVPVERISKRVFRRKSAYWTVGVYVMRLRKKLGAEAIITVTGEGFRMGRDLT